MLILWLLLNHLELLTKELTTAGASGTATGSWTSAGGGDGRTHAFHIALVPSYTGPTLSLPGVNSITATSATPKVTLTF